MDGLEQQAPSLVERAGDPAGGVQHDTSAIGKLAGAVVGEQHAVSVTPAPARDVGGGQQSA